MEPLNYQMAVSNPFASVLQGLQSGLAYNQGVQQLDAARQEQDFMQRQRVAYEAQQKLATEQAAAEKQFMQYIAGQPSLTTEDILRAQLVMPGQGERLNKMYSALDEKEKSQKASSISPVFTALASGKPDIAKKLLNDAYTAAKNSGDEQSAAGSQALLKQIDLNPKGTQLSLGMTLANLMGREKFDANYKAIMGAAPEEGKTYAEVEKLRAEAAKLEAEGKTAEADALLKQIEVQYKPQQVQAGLAKTQAEVQNLVSQATERAGRLALDRQKFYDESDKWKSELGAKLEEMRTKNATLPDDARKLVNENVATAAVAKQDAAQMRDLAGRMREQGNTGSGFGTSAWEWVKGATGNQDYMSGLRQEYARVRASGVISSLPPGPATDRDIAIFSRGFPPENADAQYIAEFLDATARLKDAASAQAEIKAEWTNSVGSLGRTRKDIEVDGVMVPAGTSYLDFQKNYLPRKLKSASEAEKTTSRQEQIKAGNRPYLEGWRNFATGGQ